MNCYTYTEYLANFGVGGAHPGSLQTTKNILNQLNIPKDFHVLDVGCGTGQTLEYLSKTYNCKVTGIDNNSVMLTKAKRRLKDKKIPAHVVRGNIETLPFKDHTFDLILSESVTAFTNIYESIKECRRVLKKDGLFVAIEMTKESTLSNKEEKELIDFYGVSKILREQEWIQLFDNIGFSSIQCQLLQVHSNEGVEFDFSDDLDPCYYNIMNKHERMLNKYKNKLGSRIYICRNESTNSDS